MEPVIPVPEMQGTEVPRLDLMKDEIEQHIVRMKAERARGEIKIDDFIETIPKEKRIELAKKIASGETELREEPADYSGWTFADFEIILPGLEDTEDLEELFERVDESRVLTESNAETLRNLIKQRIAEITRGYEMI